MASLLHILDTDSLEKNPNLHFDPQNASAHLSHDHPNFQELKEGLSPEQIEILENTSQVDGFDLDNPVARLDDDDEMIDPETGETIKLNDVDLTLSELGFVDPAQLRTLVLEAFYHPQFDTARKRISETYGELSGLQRELHRTGFVSRLQANNVNAALGGTLYDSIIMESFTAMPTKTNYNLVMEEIDKGKTALAVGGAVVGAAILYKLIKWFLNSWNKNAVASGSIAGNIKNIQDRKARIENATDVVNKANTALAQTIADLKNSRELDNGMKEFLGKIQGIQNVSERQQAIELLGKLEIGIGVNALRPVYSNLWLSISQAQQVTVGGGKFIANKAFFDAIPLVIGGCKEIQNLVNSQIENIRTTGADKAIQDKDSEYKKALNIYTNFGTLCGYTTSSDKLYEYANGLMEHILQNIVAPLGSGIVLKDAPSTEKLQVINPEAWANVNDDYEKDVEEFQKRITELNGKEGNDGFFGVGKKPAQPDLVQQGDAVQRDSRVAEYEKLVSAFRASMCMMRALLAIRNNLGKGLAALNKASEKVYGK